MASTELQKLMSQLKMNKPTTSMPVLARAKSVNSKNNKKVGDMVEGPDGQLYNPEQGYFDDRGNYHVYDTAPVIIPATSAHPHPAHSAHHVRRQRHEPKVFNPDMQYTPDHISKLYDFQGEIPIYNPVLINRRSDGSYDFENTSPGVLAIILRRMISMYLTDKRRSTKTIRENKRLINALLETKKKDDYEFRKLEETGYKRIYKR